MQERTLTIAGAIWYTSHWLEEILAPASLLEKKWRAGNSKLARNGGADLLLKKVFAPLLLVQFLIEECQQWEHCRSSLALIPSSALTQSNRSTTLQECTYSLALPHVRQPRHDADICMYTRIHLSIYSLTSRTNMHVCMPIIAHYSQQCSVNWN